MKFLFEINVFHQGVGSSNTCGNIAPELKFAGYDHIVINGRSDSPVYLWINDNHVEIKNALMIWGKTTWTTDDLLKEEEGEIGFT